jgi:signal transduction histidine kinase
MTRSQVRALLHPDDQQRAADANARAIASRGDYDIEYRVRRPSGQWAWVAAKGRGIYDAKGRLVRMMGVVQDITPRKLAEEALRASEAELRAAQVQLHAHATELEHKVEARTASLREAIGQMEEFSYSVSHDLRSPLRAMNGYAQALLEDYGAQLDETARSYLERIQRSAVRMENLTHDVLNYSRIARGEVQLAPVDLGRLLSELIEQYAELQPSVADVEIRQPLHAVLAHEPSLGQCLGNLLTNAAKFVREGEKPRIRVGTEARDGRVRIWVEDDGIGVPPEYHKALFQVFERLPTQVRYEGTGIGLAIVRKAAEKMGGTCGVESDGRRGSRFWVELARA